MNDTVVKILLYIKPAKKTTSPMHEARQTLKV